MKKFTTESGVEFTIRPAVGRQAMTPMRLMKTLGVDLTGTKKDGAEEAGASLMKSILDLDQAQLDTFFNEFEVLLALCVVEGVDTIKVNNELDLSLNKIFDVLSACAGLTDEDKKKE